MGDKKGEFRLKVFDEEGNLKKEQRKVRREGEGVTQEKRKRKDTKWTKTD